MLRTIFLFVVFAMQVPSISFAACSKNIPYAVQTKEGKIEVNVDLFKNVAKTDSLNAKGGIGFIKSAYAAAAQQALSDILEYYCCVIEDSVSKNATISATDKVNIKTEITRAAALMNLDATEYFTTYTTGDLKALKDIKTEIKIAKRSADDPTIDLKLFDDSIGKIDLEKTFLQETKIDAWVKASIASAQITACGGVAIEALAKNKDQIQHVVASARPIYRLYLDNSNQYTKMLALAKLFAEASTVGKIDDNVSKSEFLKDCTDQIKK